MATQAQAKPHGDASLDTLDAEIAAQNDALNQLRLSGAPSDEVDQAKKKLGELKRARAVLTGQVGKERVKEKGREKDKEKDKEKGKDADEAGRMLLKTAKVGVYYDRPRHGLTNGVEWMGVYIGNAGLWAERDVLPVAH